MRKLKTWWTDLRWLTRGDRLFLIFPAVVLLAVGCLFVTLLVAGEWVAVFPLLGFIGIFMTTVNAINDQVRDNKWWSDFRTAHKLAQAELTRIRQQKEWKL